VRPTGGTQGDISLTGRRARLVARDRPSPDRVPPLASPPRGGTTLEGVTSDHEHGETVLDREGVGPLDPDALAREAAAAARPLPAPRPEILARVLDGLRDLPAVTRDAPRGDGEADGERALPLPRRRS